jgi:hypothetical protein
MWTFLRAAKMRRDPSWISSSFEPRPRCPTETPHVVAIDGEASAGDEVGLTRVSHQGELTRLRIVEETVVRLVVVHGRGGFAVLSMPVTSPLFFIGLAMVPSAWSPKLSKATELV